MASILNVGLTADPYVNGLLTGVKWASASQTYSFPSSASLYPNYGSNEPQTGFAAFTAVQQQAVAKVLQNYSAVSNLQFTQMTETANSSAVIRYAETNATSTAWGYYPSSSVRGGDTWFNNASHYYDNPVRGNYAYNTLLHETGHAIGLKHPQDVMGSFGALPADHDSIEYTVMSYHSYVGGPMQYTAASTSYAQTLMMDDITAVQTLYGANYTTNSGNTVYRWSPTNGTETINGVAQDTPAGNKIFMTVWDGGGNDTYDFSNYTTALKVDLNPGAWTTVSTTQLASLGGGHSAAGNIANAHLFQGNTASIIENAIGGTAGDILSGNQADNQLTGGAGNDILSGGAGTDTALYSGTSTNYSWSQNSDATWTVTDLRAGSPDGTDKLAGIEKLQFSNATITLGGSAASANTFPVIISSPYSVTVTEFSDGSTNEKNNVTHKASGTISFWDPDVTDAHTASFVAEAAGYIGTFNPGTLNDGTDALPWSFAVADSAMDFLTGGQTRVQKYDVTIKDGHGGSAMQTVTITLVGKNDATTTTTTAVVASSIAPHDPNEFYQIDEVPLPAYHDADTLVSRAPDLGDHTIDALLEHAPPEFYGLGLI